MLNPGLDVIVPSLSAVAARFSRRIGQAAEEEEREGVAGIVGALSHAVSRALANRHHLRAELQEVLEAAGLQKEGTISLHDVLGMHCAWIA